MLATQARAGMAAQARAALTALDDENARPGEIRNARAAICLAEGDPAAALAAVQDVLDGTAQPLRAVPDDDRRRLRPPPARPLPGSAVDRRRVDSPLAGGGRPR